MDLKNIYTVKVLDTDNMVIQEKTGKPTWLVVLQENVSWSAYAIIPDFGVTDTFDLDIIFDDDFRKTTDIKIGDRLTIDFSIVNKSIGIREVEVIDIRKDIPINHLQNKKSHNIE